MEKEKYQRTENPLLDEILQKYRDCSTDSISGPKGFGERVGKKPWPTTDSKEKQVIVSSVDSKRTLNPVLRSVTTRMHVQFRDQGTLKFKETLVDQFPLACFSYGGEKRLCFKDLVDKVLKGFSTQAINTARDRLQIFCPRCTPQQLEILKLAGVLPWSCTSAGLISKSDAFRLIGVLTCSTVLARINRLFSVDSLEVYHECFGGCVGTLEIDLYTDPYAECVTCSQCDGIFSPRTFVTHTHSSGEVHTCHWGFDSAHWRLYLMLCNDHPTIHVQMMWEMLTSKFTEGSRRRLKREYVETGLADKEYNSSHSGESRISPSLPEKKPKDGRSSASPKDKEVSEERYVYCSNGVVTTTGGEIMCRRSAFRPWSPVGNRTNGRTVENGIGTPLAMLGPVSPARIFAPSTISCINSDCHGTSPCSPRGQYAYKSSLTKSDEGSESNKISEVISTPTSKDPMSLERTAKDMLDVVAQNDHGWNAFEEAYSHIKNGVKEEVNVDRVVSFNEDNIYHTLLGYSKNGELPSVKELSSLLAKDFKNLFIRSEAKTKQVLQEKSDLEDICEFSKRENAKKMEELYEELRKCKKDLRLCQARYKDETHEQKNIINGLEAELRRYKLDKEGSEANGSNESLEVLQQEVRDMCIKLEQKDSFCRELENELSSMHAWIKSQRYHPASSFVYSYGSPRRPESRTVIRSVQLVNGNSENSPVKSNGIAHHDSSEEDM
ncbi:ski oncogene-like [Actinia tenebrosa]|uniref:Ski oncogene-like n=1 Tax=Actinia tenebrosa TaxID=6105 RepID=A0A6P8IJU0_ACTTE|nr:ski oncogene-like [Actinia tenebrosa]